MNESLKTRRGNLIRVHQLLLVSVLPWCSDFIISHLPQPLIVYLLPPSVSHRKNWFTNFKNKQKKTQVNVYLFH